MSEGVLKKPADEPKKRGSLKWDEANLQKNEEEKVPRMKIPDPDTPYHYYNEDEDEDLQKACQEQAELQSKEATAEKRSPAVISFSSADANEQPKGLSAGFDADELAKVALERRAEEDEWEKSDDSDEGGVDVLNAHEKRLRNQKQKDFKVKRAAHYNMGALLKRGGAVDTDDESDEEEKKD